MAWYNSLWLNRKKATVDATKVPGALTDYLATIDLRDSDIQSQIQADGADILVTATDGTTKLNHHIQQRKHLIPDGVWSWFSNPRAIYHSGTHEKTYWVVVADGGDIVIYSYNHKTAVIDNFTLDVALQDDDHNHGSIYVRTDGKLVVAWGKHNVDANHYYRVSTNAEDISAWGTKQTITLTNSLTYQNLIYLESNSTLYLFYRHANSGTYTWRYITSADEGSTWSTTENEFWTNGSSNQLYCQFAKNGTDRIDVVATDRHPSHAGAASVYHMYLEDSVGDKWRKSDGTDITTSLPLAPADVTQIYDGTTNEGWLWDIAIDDSGYPCVLFPVFMSSTDHRYYITRWGGSSWSTPAQITTAGSYLYAAEPNYSAGIVFDRSDVTLSTVYLIKEASTVFEVQKWVDSAGWSKSEDVTTGSTAGIVQARPVSPWNQPANKRMGVIWWSGSYVTYVNFHTNMHCYPALLPRLVVKIPSVSSSVDTDIYVYYNNATATDQQDQINTWSDVYFHIDFDFEPGRKGSVDKTGNAYDFTQNANFGTGNMLSPEDAITEIGGAVDYEGVAGDFGTIDSSFSLAGDTEFSAEAVVKWDGGGINEHTILSSWATAGTSAQFLFRIEPADSTLEVFLTVEPNTAKGGTATGTSVGTTNYEHVAATFDAADVRGCDETACAVASTTGAAMDANASPQLFVGKTNPAHTLVTDYFKGHIAQLRFNKARRSSDYLTATKNNLTDMSAFYTLGTEETEPAGGATIPILMHHYMHNIGSSV